MEATLSNIHAIYNLIGSVMKSILRISQFIFGSGLWLFFIKWLIDGIKNVRIKNRFFKNVIYEVFFNTMAMEFTCETNWEILENPRRTDIMIYKYSFTAWQILLQSGFIKNIRFKDMLILQYLYFQIEKLDERIKRHYDLTYDRRIASRETFKGITDRLIKLHNEFVTSNVFKNWEKKYGESFQRDQLELISEFRGEKFSPSVLSQRAEESE